MARKAQSAKVNISIREDLLTWVDDYAGENAMSRSGLISMALMQYKTAVESMPSLNKLMASMVAVVEGTFSGELTPEQAQAQLERIQTTYQTLTAKN